jgi:hypothetical protein
VDAIRKGDYRTACRHLRDEWAFWRSHAKLYGFGRVNLQPIKSSAEAISFYVGKYISKHIGARKAEDKGVRLAEFSKGSRIGTTRFAWHTPGYWCWRQKLKLLAGAVGARDGEMQRFFGRRWAYRLAPIIEQIELTHYPSLEHARADGRDVKSLPADVDPFSPVTWSNPEGRISANEAAGLAIELVLQSFLANACKATRVEQCDRSAPDREAHLRPSSAAGATETVPLRRWDTTFNNLLSAAVDPWIAINARDSS